LNEKKYEKNQSTNRQHVNGYDIKRDDVLENNEQGINTRENFDDDLSYVYDLGEKSDYSLSSYTPYADYYKDDGEIKTLLLKVLNDNKKIKEKFAQQERHYEEYREKITKLEAREGSMYKQNVHPMSA
jgi:hypothetical protein